MAIIVKVSLTVSAEILPRIAYLGPPDPDTVSHHEVNSRSPMCLSPAPSVGLAESAGLRRVCFFGHQSLSWDSSECCLPLHMGASGLYNFQELSPTLSVRQSYVSILSTVIGLCQLPCLGGRGRGCSRLLSNF